MKEMSEKTDCLIESEHVPLAIIRRSVLRLGVLILPIVPRVLKPVLVWLWLGCFWC